MLDQGVLPKRIFKVAVNGTWFDEENVLSGVPLGTGKASILFMVTLNDIEKEARESVSLRFADDTRVC